MSWFRHKRLRFPYGIPRAIAAPLDQIVRYWDKEFNELLTEMINRPIDYDVLRPRAFIDMTLAQQEDIIPERCAGYFSPEAIAERWPQHSTVYTSGKTYTLAEYFAGYEALWASRTPRVEWNTVDLKDLRAYRQTFYEYRRWRWEEHGY